MIFRNVILGGGCGIRTHGSLLNDHRLATCCFGPLSQPSLIIIVTIFVLISLSEKNKKRNLGLDKNYLYDTIQKVSQKGSFLIQIKNIMDILNKATKSGILVMVLSVGFFSPFAGLIVEGSPSTLINASEQEILSINEEFYNNSGNTFFTAVNSPQPSIKTKKITATAYSSTPDETDDSPFITASGTWVYDGVIASNFLPFGTKVRFPELFRDKVFTVDDKMHKRFTDTRVDIWFPDKESAKKFGIKETIMEILE